MTMMKPEELRGKLHGVIAFPVTPFKTDLSLDISGLRNNLQGLLKYPISAVVAAGGTGEMYSLTPSEHQEVVKATVEEVHGKVPVIAGTGFNRQIAIDMRISEKTVENRLSRLFARTGCRSRVELAAASLEGRLLDVAS